MQVTGAKDTHKICCVCVFVCTCTELSGQNKTLTLPVLMALFTLGPLRLKNTSTHGSVFGESFVQMTYKSMTPSTQPNKHTHLYSEADLLRHSPVTELRKCPSWQLVVQ